MRHLRALSITLLLVTGLLSSCEEGGFSVQSPSLAQEVVYDSDGSSSRHLVFSASMSVDDSYSLSLTGPDGLVWEGALTNEPPYYISDELMLTRGASFSEGDYGWRIMNSHGREVTGTISWQEGDVVLPGINRYGWVEADGPVLVRSSDGAQAKLQPMEEVPFTGPVSLTVQDGHGNSYTVNSSVPPSASSPSP